MMDSKECFSLRNLDCYDEFFIVFDTVHNIGFMLDIKEKRKEINTELIR